MADVVVRLVITGAAGAITSVNAAFPTPPALRAPRVMVDDPLVVGVPLMTPDAKFTMSPSGNGVAENWTAVLVAMMV